MSIQTATFQEKGEPKRIRTEVPLLKSLTHCRWAKPAHGVEGDEEKEARSALLATAPSHQSGTLAACPGLDVRPAVPMEHSTISSPLLSGVILKGLILPKCVSDVCVCIMFFEVTGFVD